MTTKIKATLAIAVNSNGEWDSGGSSRGNWEESVRFACELVGMDGLPVNVYRIGVEIEAPTLTDAVPAQAESVWLGRIAEKQ